MSNIRLDHNNNETYQKQIVTKTIKLIYQSIIEVTSDLLSK